MTFPVDPVDVVNPEQPAATSGITKAKYTAGLRLLMGFALRTSLSQGIKTLDLDWGGTCEKKANLFAKGIHLT